MNEGWLCDSILKAQAQPSPTSMIPAFSPGPCTTSLLRVGSRFRWTRDDLYEQCSLHITLKMPSSVREGSRPRAFLMRLYSSGVMPWSAMTSGVMAEACVVGMRYFYFRIHGQERCMDTPVPKRRDAALPRLEHCGPNSET